jgi:hypothetical protein
MANRRRANSTNRSNTTKSTWNLFTMTPVLHTHSTATK